MATPVSWAVRPQRPESEPSLLLHAPLSARSQDVRHVLTKAFKEFFTRDLVSPETIKNLLTSKGSDDEYHERYVERLRAAYEQRERGLAETAALEKHIMQSQAKAISAEERHVGHSDVGTLRQLGMPVGQNHYRSCVDGDMLRRHRLIAPDMYAIAEAPRVDAPRPAAEPAYMMRTTAFAHNVKGQKEKRERLSQSQRARGETLSDCDSGPSPDADATLGESDEESERPSFDECGRPAGAAKTRPSWKNQMNTERREKEKELLTRLQQRADYLKNPRFDPQSPKLLTEPTKRSRLQPALAELAAGGSPEKDCPAVFVPCPATVLFSEYAAGQVYEATLELKNISASLQPVRVLPPRTGYFGLSLGQFPGEQGLVAAGMSARYRVRFMPDSLGEYQDEILVQSPCTAQPVLVKLAARRMPPVLSLPSCIDAGHSLVGGVRVTRYEVRNEGGPGKFCMMAKSKWPAANFKSVVNPAAMQLPPFQVQPAVFELHHGESCILTVAFRPTQAEVYEQSMVMVCDNCHVKEFTLRGEGQFARVEFLAVDGGASEPEPGELCDVSAQKLIRFDELNPYTFSQKNLLLNNVTRVDLPFEWKLVKPLTEVKHAGNDDDNADSSSSVITRMLDFTSAFSIHPQAGILPAGEVSKFTLSFAPAEVAAYHGVMHLVLPDIPGRPGTTASLLPPAGSQTANESAAGDRNKDNAFNLLTALEIECKGCCVPLNVLLKPYALYINGAFLIGTTTRKHFHIINNSLSPIIFRWDYPASEHILEVIPPIGEVGPGGVTELEVTVTGCKAGLANELLRCYVKYIEQPLILPVHFEVKGPEVVFDEADLNFGLVRFSTAAKSVLHIRNTSEMLINWSIAEKPAAMETSEDDTFSQFVFTPSEGELKPLGSRAITVQFFPQTCKSLQTFFKLDVNGGESNRCISVTAEVQNPEVCFLSCKLDISKVFLKMPMSQYITIVNKTYLKTEYTFGKPFGSGAELCKIDINQKGEIGPRDQIELELTFTALQKVDKIADVRLPCYVLGMDEPLIMLISANVESLSVTCSVFDSLDTRFSSTRSSIEGLDFGTVDLGRPERRYLSIRNNTAIPASYSVAMDYFSAPPLPALQATATAAGPSATQDEVQKSNGSPTKLLLKKTLNLVDPTSKTKQQAETELKQTILSRGLGMAIYLRPSAGMLQAYEETLIEMEVYSDMWGHYTDTVVCCVGDLEPISVPVRVDVSGVPLQFQMAANQAAEKEVTLRFGTHASNSEVVCRKVRINNISPLDMRLDWQFFSVKDGDDQILDLIVAYGDPFPLVEDPTSSASKKSNAMPKAPVVRSGDELGDEPLIKLVVGPHQGVRTVKPYLVSPAQTTIAARGSAYATFMFDPRLGDPAGGEFLSYALAFLTINSEARETPSKVKRSMGYETMQLKLNITGTIKPAVLAVEYMDDEGLVYPAAASDLLAADAPSTALQSIKKHSAVKVTNQTEAVLRFKVHVPEPFFYEGSSSHVGSRDAEYLELKQGQSTQLDVSFVVKQSLLDLAESLAVGQQADIGSHETTLCIQDGERQLFFSQKLQILFSNGAIQELPLRASLVVPSFATSRSSLDFGTCLVGQKKQLTFTLYNRTRSGTVWTSHVQPLTGSCSHETFSAAPASGKLDAHIAHITKSSVVVAVCFIAKDAEDYEAQVVIEGRLGERPLIIRVKGSGSYDERHENLISLELEPAAS